MKKIITIKPTNEIHCAVGRKYKVTFDDGSVDEVYDETLINTYCWNESKGEYYEEKINTGLENNWDNLIGEIWIEE